MERLRAMRDLQRRRLEQTTFLIVDRQCGFEQLQPRPEYRRGQPA